MIRDELFSLRDEEYAVFQARIVPTVDPGRVIGVRTPQLRKLAKELAGKEETEAFLKQLPHEYFEEDQLHAFIISGMKKYPECLRELEAFLPFIDNWATCDQLSPKVFAKHKAELLGPVGEWIASGETYKVRFGIKMLMEHFLDEDFDPSYPETVARIRSDEYYVRMMAAWYFATALAKQYDTAVTFLEDRRLDEWTHNKTIQKAIESYRISPEKKEYLRGLRIKRKAGE